MALLFYGSIQSKIAVTTILDIHRNDHHFSTGLLIDVMFGSRVGFLAKLRLYTIIGT